MTPSARKRLVLFTKFPVPGKVKTRLIPSLGAEGSAGLHRRLVLRTLRTARDACKQLGADLEIHFEGGTEEALHHWLGDDLSLVKQAAGNLGHRMETAFEAGFRNGSPATVIIGSDCPLLTPQIIISAFHHLARSQAVFGPANDGGYYLIGLSSPIPELFQEIPWSTERVLSESLRVLDRKKIVPTLLEPLDDLDRPEDLVHWNRLTLDEDSDLNGVSVIIPTLNEASHIVVALHNLQQSKPRELIVADGGSTDDTPRLAEAAGALVIRSKAGRARQMNAGAAQAQAKTLLFLHVDTSPPPHWPTLIRETLRGRNVAAGAFRLEIQGRFAAKRMIEWSAGLRSRWFQLPYGDQGLFLARSLFETLGGFPDLPIMEDYEMVRRLRRFGRIVTTSQPALTSGRRWEKLGGARVTLLNQFIVAGYHLGVSPHRLAAFYRGSSRLQQSKSVE
jgi:rSAM/selenodomain-associated transferase 2/rSAM/selenodomain-associated transferase 1